MEGTVFRCDYDIQATATGEAGSDGVWVGVRRETTTLRDSYTQRDSAPREALIEFFGTDRIRPGEVLKGRLASGFTFPSAVEENGAMGAHRAKWTFEYRTGGVLQSASYDMECTAPPLPAHREPLAGRYALVSIGKSALPAWGRHYQVAADTLEFFADSTYTERSYIISRDFGGTYLTAPPRRRYQVVSRDTVAITNLGGAQNIRAMVLRTGRSLVYVDASGFPEIQWRWDMVVAPAAASRQRAPALLPLPSRAD